MSNKEIKIKIAIDTDSKEVVVLKDEVKKLGNVFNDTDSSTSKLLKRIDLFSGVYFIFQTIKNSIGQVASVPCQKI